MSSTSERKCPKCDAPAPFVACGCHTCECGWHIGCYGGGWDTFTEIDFENLPITTGVCPNMEILPLPAEFFQLPWTNQYFKHGDGI